MGVEQNEESEPVRELRLEGVGLALLVAILLLAVAGSFYAGRWYERRQAPSPAAAEGAGGSASDPLAHVVPAEEVADLDATRNYFDDLAGDEKQAEPRREVSRPKPAEARSDEAPAGDSDDSPSVTAISPAAPFSVQVFAGRDRGAAEQLVGKLKREGRDVRLVTFAEGGGSLFKVRIGGYATRDAAVSAAQELQQQGYPGAWVPSIDP